MEKMFEFFSKNDLVSKRRVAEFVKYFAREDNWHHLDLKNGGLGYGWIHYSLIRLLQPKRVLCIGSKWGFIPAVCAMACRDNGRGRVDFVDAGYNIDEYGGPGEHWGGVGWWKKCDPKKYFGRFGLEKYIKLYVMKSEEFKKIDKSSEYGYVHIDGDHSYFGVKKDFENFWPQVKKGGFLAIHDIGSPDIHGLEYGTRKFWIELKNKSNTFFEIMENPGLGVVQK
jgi:hypothetical protein